MAQPNNYNQKILLSASVFLAAVLRVQAASDFIYEKLPPLPDREGFAGSFAGVSRGTLLVAGGANFPDKKPWEDGKKVWHDTIYALDKPEGPWRIIGRLPRPIGYGVSITCPEGLVCIGGSDRERHYTEVFVVTLAGTNPEIYFLAGLPMPLANGAGALAGSTIYIYGGSEAPGEHSASSRLFALDLGAASRRWQELAPCPGKGRILPVAAALEGRFYLAGGAALEAMNGKTSRVYLRDAWCYQPGKGWKRLAEMPKAAVGAASAAPVFGPEFLIIGGDDGSLANFRPVEKHPGFPKSILAYNSVTGSWRMAGEVPASRVTLPAAWWRGRFVLPSGEVHPGVRSPEVWTLQANH